MFSYLGVSTKLNNVGAALSRHCKDGSQKQTLSIFLSWVAGDLTPIQLSFS
jgi:hypothetical protein